MITDTIQRYGGVTRFLHWVMAVLIAAQFLKFGDRIAEGEHWIGQTVVPWHISIGALLLALVVARTLWALTQRPRRVRHAGAIRPLVAAGHFMLYASMLLMPMAGMLLMLGNGYGLTVFGLQLVAKTGVETGWMAWLGSFHSPLAWLFVTLVLGHVAATLYHHFVRRDETLVRMLR